MTHHVHNRLSRRRFLQRTAAVGSALAALPLASCAKAEPEPTASSDAAPAPAAAPVSSGDSAGQSRVVVIRHDALAAERGDLTPQRAAEFLNEAAKALAGEAKPADAWAQWFKPDDRVAVKVNCLGLSTRPAVAGGLVRALGAIDLPASGAILWDRTNRELQRAGYDLQARGNGPRCFGTDALSSRGHGGYSADVHSSGATGSLISRIVTDEADALASAAVLKDHNLAGLTGVMKNFFGAIHNPNKYHDNNCSPFIADAVAQKPIRSRLRLALVDATRPQYQGGPASRPKWQWPYGALIVSTDPVAADAVGREILARKRESLGLKAFEAEVRPVRYLAAGEARGLGTANLKRIEVVSIGKRWLDV